MSLSSKLKRLAGMTGSFLGEPRRGAGRLATLPEVVRADAFCRGWSSPSTGGEGDANGIPRSVEDLAPLDPSNPLWQYFQAYKEGPGIWKWTHYFDIYQRHLGRFVGTDAHVVEIGVYSGGSLRMWRHYFGPRCRITGVDIEPACKVYEAEGTHIVIGDQGDRGFWKRFLGEAPPIDVIIDDGGHHPEQQRVTLEETLPRLRPGGVYLCEDIFGIDNKFATYVHALADHLNAPCWGYGRTPFQDAVSSIHLYPFVVVIERAERPVRFFFTPKRGTEWQPFFDDPVTNQAGQEVRRLREEAPGDRKTAQGSATA